MVTVDALAAGGSVSIRYVPILKGKPGEYGALTQTFVTVRAGMLPLIEALPAGKETVEEACASTMRNLDTGWNGPFAVDAVYLDPATPLSSGQLPLEVLADEARARRLAVLPVLRLDDDPAVWTAAAAVVARDKAGVVVRLGGDPLQEDVGDLDTYLSSLYSVVGITPSDVDLVIDLGGVTEPGYAALAARIARDLINGLKDVASWRSLTVASGGFPVDLSAVPTGSTALLPRTDARLWSTLTARSLARSPDYGDYAIQHPGPPATGGRGPAPQIRYAVGLDWRIRKALTNVRRGHAQFYDICADVVASGEFSGATFSWGDEQVDLAARSAPMGAPALRSTGNATTWRGIGTSHHLALVSDRLATLSAP